MISMRTETQCGKSSRFGDLALRSGAALLARSGLLRRSFLRQGALRVLGYHGVCRDDVVGGPWVPSHFVGVSEFRRQMEIAKRYAPVINLADEFGMRGEDLQTTGPRLAVTFDDVAACTFTNALPVLAELEVRASFYVSTGHVTSGKLFHGDVLRLIRHMPWLVESGERQRLQALIDSPSSHKRMSPSQLSSELADAEAILRARLPTEVFEALRALDWGQVESLAEAGHEIGAHTVDHVVLGHQDGRIRRDQIVESLRALKSRLGGKVLGFAYPNGGPDDFGELDAEILRESGVRYALSTRPGFVDDSPRYSLPRVCVGLNHDRYSFEMALSGLLDRRQQREQAWH